MRKIIKGDFKETTVRMEKWMWDLLFEDANKWTKKEERIVSVPETIRRIIRKHYKIIHLSKSKAR